jgi:hypothetical protein
MWSDSRPVRFIPKEGPRSRCGLSDREEKCSVLAENRTSIPRLFGPYTNLAIFVPCNGLYDSLKCNFSYKKLKKGYRTFKINVLLSHVKFDLNHLPPYQ